MLLSLADGGGRLSTRCVVPSRQDFLSLSSTCPAALSCTRSSEEVRDASWMQPSDIKAQFGSASILKNRRVVFNIKGNDYRLVVAVAYRYQSVYIKFVGTHAQYDAIDVLTVEVPQ